jgi:dihydroorotate dehydrogenase electron transfer subunit
MTGGPPTREATSGCDESPFARGTPGAAVASAERPLVFEARVESNRALGGGGFVLSARAAGLDVRLRPGEFLQARAWPGHDPLLRRPLAPLDVRRDGDGTRLDLLYTAVGRGTRVFADLRPGDALSLLGPLGRGYSPLPPGRAVLVAGGVGVAPVHHLAREAAEAGRRADLTVILGARERRLLYGADLLEALGVEVRLATDRGDAGFAGNAVQAFEALLRDGARPAIVLGCGPEPMLESLVRTTKREGLRCEVSLERRMACGFGVCFTCVCRAIDAKTGIMRNVRTCLEGPVIDASRLPNDAW